MENELVGLRGHIVIDGFPSMLVKGLVGVEKLRAGGLRRKSACEVGEWERRVLQYSS